MDVPLCGGASLVTMSVIYLEFKSHNQYGNHSILQRYTIPSGLGLVGLSFVFQQDNNPNHISSLCKGYLTKESDGVLHWMTWPPQSPDLNSIEMVWDEWDGRVKEKLVWDELDHRVKEKQTRSAQHMWELLQDCWKSIPHETG